MMDMVMLMREYNLFIIKKEYCEIYEKKPELLYEILKKLYFMKSDYNYGIFFFEQICNSVAIDAIRYYLNSKYSSNYNNYFPFNSASVYLKYSRIIIQSKYNMPSILKIFNRYSRNIFVVDFENKDYFFLDSFIRNKVLETV